MSKFTERQYRKAITTTRLAFAFGALTTVAINLAHAADGLGAKLAALPAPICLLFAVEIMLVVPDPESRWMKRAKYGITGLVGLAALLISYTHTAQLFLEYGEHPLVAWITPIVPDGMMIAASVALFHLGRIREQMDQRIEQKARRAAQPKPVNAASVVNAAVVETLVSDLRAGREVSAAALAEENEKSTSWAQTRIREAKKQLAAA